MNYIKWGLVGILAAICTMVVFQNADFLKTTYSLGVDFKLSDAWVYHTPELPNGLFLLIAAFIGVIAGYGATLPGWFRTKKAMKQNADEIKALQAQVNKLKNRPAPSFSLEHEEEPATEEEAPAAESASEKKETQETATP